MGSMQGPFKQRYYNHKSSLPHEIYRHKTSFSNYVWKVKNKLTNGKPWKDVVNINKIWGGNHTSSWSQEKWSTELVIGC